jgi:hypothetical protein
MFRLVLQSFVQMKTGLNCHRKRTVHADSLVPEALQTEPIEWALSVEVSKQLLLRVKTQAPRRFRTSNIASFGYRQEENTVAFAPFLYAIIPVPTPDHFSITLIDRVCSYRNEPTEVAEGAWARQPSLSNRAGFNVSNAVICSVVPISGIHCHSTFR